MTDYTEFEADIEDLSRHEFGSLPPPGSGSRIVLGVCAMPKKARSKPMRAILGRLNPDEFEIVTFSEETIFEKPVDEWPLCHALIAFFSDGFPLDKAEAYAELRKPFLVNELKPQHLLKDRRHVMKMLEKFGVPVPDHVIVNRSSSSPSGFPVEVNTEDEMQEFDDYIVVKGKRMDKPFVEKPVDGDNHNICVYYPRSSGGGSCRLFRKVKDRSSEFFPDENKVRRDGSYIYESFLRTEGSDVKVYTVTSSYAHSEARKSPTIDGVVTRNEKGFEVRYPILLSAMEKEIANLIVQAFGQRICGFDVLRSDSMSYVCDVNGWSFVKNNHKYYDDFALILSDMLRGAMGITAMQTFWPGSSGSDDDSESDSVEDSTTQGTHSRHSSVGHGSVGSLKHLFKQHVEQPHEELRCVIAVVRHGDRTPKQKLKIKVVHAKILALFDKYGERTSHEELKLKSASQLSAVLDIIVQLITATEKARGGELDDSDCEDRDKYDLLLQARSVLEMHGTFKGINRKVQLKPIAWDDTTGRIIEAQFILKWGGVLTLAGRQQAELMGQSFRQKLYPFDGLLRLHSTYRHDLKVYSSNEGRVQVTAAAFAKGLLSLEGHLTPILTSLVRKSDEVDSVLDHAGDAKQPIEKIKKRLHNALLATDPDKQELKDAIAATDATSVLDALEHLGFNPRESMHKLHEHIHSLVQQLRICVKSQRARFGVNAGSAGVANTGKLLEPDTATSQSEGGSAAASLDRVESDRNLQSIVSEDTGTALLMSLYRWSKLEKDFFQKKKDKFDLSKIPDIHDSVKFDLLHNPQLSKLRPPNLQAIFDISSALADVIVPQEYGIRPEEKKSVGSRIARSLVAKIQSDLINTVSLCMPTDRRHQLRREQSTSILNPMGLDTVSVMTGCDASVVNSETGEAETFHRLDKRYARSLGIKSSDRMVRTRLYFTSESHLHSLLSVLRYAAAETVQVDPSQIEVDMPALTAEAEAQLSGIKELNYMTHIVFRLFEIIPPKRRTAQRSRIEKTVPEGPELSEPEIPSRFRISVGISPGVEVSTDEYGNYKQGVYGDMEEAAAAAAAEAAAAQETGQPMRPGTPPYPPPSLKVPGSPSGSSCGSSVAGSTCCTPTKKTLPATAAEAAASLSDYGSKADIQLLPCSPLVSLWKGIELSKLNTLFTRVLHDVEVELTGSVEDGGSSADINPVSPYFGSGSQLPEVDPVMLDAAVTHDSTLLGPAAAACSHDAKPTHPM